MKKSIWIIIMWVSALVGRANDGVFFTSGNFLVPVRETDISVGKEILTIIIGKDGYAKVDVRYEFDNRGGEKDLTMAFEASSPYNALAPLNRNGIHPYIEDFTVSMNGVALPCRNAVVACRDSMSVHNVDFTPLDMTRWKGYGEVPDSILPSDDSVISAEADGGQPVTTAFAYAYYFDARFKPGVNKVHHTYRYKMSYNVAQKFNIPYWLTPAMRWANRQVDDFTLRIAADEATEFCMADTLFASAPFVSLRHQPIYHISNDCQEHALFARLQPGDTIVWHGTGFKPVANISIDSPEWLMDNVMNRWETSAKMVVKSNRQEYKYVAECGDGYLVVADDYQIVSRSDGKVMEYSAEKGQGWVSVDFAEASMVNVRERPTTRSRIVGTIGVHGDTGGRSVCYPCLGVAKGLRPDVDFDLWFKVKVDGRTGYVSQRVTRWNGIPVPVSAR